MICDMCSGEGLLYKVNIENSELAVCQKCSKFGKVIGLINYPVKEKKLVNKYEQQKTEFMNIIIKNYSEKIKNKRETINLTQKEFAKKINEKESVIHQIESGHSEPSLSLAKKIQKYLKIRLIEEYEEKHDSVKHSKVQSFTIGDFIKVKKS